MFSFCLIVINIFHTDASHSAPGAVLETTVQEGVNSVVLPNLLSGTEYNVQLTASYPSGQSEALLVNAKTSKSSRHKGFIISAALNAAANVNRFVRNCWKSKIYDMQIASFCFPTLKIYALCYFFYFICFFFSFTINRISLLFVIFCCWNYDICSVWD